MARRRKRRPDRPVAVVSFPRGQGITLDLATIHDLWRECGGTPGGLRLVIRLTDTDQLGPPAPCTCIDVRAMEDRDAVLIPGEAPCPVHP